MNGKYYLDEWNDDMIPLDFVYYGICWYIILQEDGLGGDSKMQPSPSFSFSLRIPILRLFHDYAVSRWK